MEPGVLPELPGRGFTVVVVVDFGTVVVTGAAVVVGLSTVVVVTSLIVVVVESTGTSSSTSDTIGNVAPLLLLEADKMSLTPLAEIPGLAWNKRAARPATCGVAIEVPEIVLVAPLPPIHAEVMEEPGAHMSTQDPSFE